MLKLCALALLSSCATAFENPFIDYKAKQNTEDYLLPSISIFGYSDLDVIDFYTGAAERAYGYDVRDNWNHCFKFLNLKDVMAKFFKMGIFKIIFGELWNMIIGSSDAEYIQDMLPHQCKQISIEISQMLIFFREEINPLE